jgi:hypothetical protein
MPLLPASGLEEDFDGTTRDENLGCDRSAPTRGGRIAEGIHNLPYGW